MTLSSTTGAGSGPVIPVLTKRVPPAELAPDMVQAFDKLQTEKTNFFALADALRENLRPELERLAEDLVQRTLRDAWMQRVDALPKSDPLTR
ncbi:MAG: hypothetical protein KAY21_04935 [Limnohabitans sp.]|nr:hypothetical protein [Limnohabitans sp.]